MERLSVDYDGMLSIVRSLRLPRTSPRQRL